MTTAVVVFLVLVVVLTPPAAGFSFLIVVPGLAIVILGAPWSALSLLLAGSYDLEGGPGVAIGAYVVPAVLNVILHAALVRRERRAGR